MRRLLLSSAALIMLAGCNAGRAESRDVGPEVSRAYPVGAFERISVAGPYDVAVTSGGASRVTASGGADLLDETEVVVEDGALVIRPKKHRGMRFNWRGPDARFVVNVAALKGASISGSGDISVDKVNGDFTGKVAGSGSIGIGAMSGGTTDIDIAGSGEFTASGAVDAIDVDIAGSGDVDVPGLRARTATISIAGSGNVRAFASDTAEVKIMGSGDVDLAGGAKCSVKKMGSGDVRCR